MFTTVAWCSRRSRIASPPTIMGGPWVDIPEGRGLMGEGGDGERLQRASVEAGHRLVIPWLVGHRSDVAGRLRWWTKCATCEIGIHLLADESGWVVDPASASAWEPCEGRRTYPFDPWGALGFPESWGLVRPYLLDAALLSPR